MLAEIGTVQLEWRYLARHVHKQEYADKVERVIKHIHDHPPRDDGLVPTYLNVNTGSPTNNQITFGALGDSYYEYLIKVGIEQLHAYRLIA